MMKNKMQTLITNSKKECKNKANIKLNHNFILALRPSVCTHSFFTVCIGTRVIVRGGEGAAVEGEMRSLDGQRRGGVTHGRIFHRRTPT